MPLTDDQIKENIKAREKAEELMEYLEEEAKNLPSDGARTRFWECLSNTAGVSAGVTKSPGPKLMSEEQAKAFGRQPMPHGMYKDMKIDKVPLEYLTWLTDSDDSFKKELRSYLRSQRIRRELE